MDTFMDHGSRIVGEQEKNQQVQTLHVAPAVGQGWHRPPKFFDLCTPVHRAGGVK